MKSFSLKNAKWLIAPLITVAIIGLMWCYYMVVYVPNRVEYLSGRNLRVLAMIGNEITSATENYNTVLRLKWQASSSTPGVGKEHKKAAEKYMIEHSFEREGSKSRLVLTYVPENLENVLHQESHQFPIGLTPHEFDIVMVVNQPGQVLFRQAPAGIQIMSLDQLVRSASVSSKQEEEKAEKNQEADSKQNAMPTVTEIRDVVVAGQTYTLFLSPTEVPVKLESNAPSSMQDKERWVIAGLVRKSQFLSECQSISYTLRSVLLSLMIVMLASIPLMRMLTLSERERVRPLNIVMFATSLLMGTALVTLFLAYMFVYTSAETRLNRQTNQLADEIAKNVREEIHQAYKQLHSMTPKVMNEWQGQQQQRSQLLGIMTPLGLQKGNMLETRVSAADDPYPFLGQVFWVDSGGGLRVNWTIWEEDPNPFINLQEREYFQHARDNRLWTIPLGSKERPHDARLWVQPIYSWDTGVNTVVLSMPLSHAVPEAAKKEFEHWVAALETKFLSLIDPVMPKGFRYAVIDERGLVLFHSQQQRNLREFFMEESDHDRTIQAALSGRMNKVGDGVYWGQDQYFVVKPLGGLPWTLVVFRDKELLRTAAAEGLATATFLLLLYALLLSVLFTAAWLLCRLGKPSHGYRVTWLWPQRDKQLAYRRIMVFNLGMSLALAWFILWGHGWKTLAVGVVIPLLAVGFAVMEWTRRRKSKSRVLNASGSLYQLTAASFVLVLSCFPAIAFFKVSYDVENDLFLKQGQLSLAKSLVKREQRVRDDYEGVTFSSKEEFLKRRLNTDSSKEPLDVYSQFFADTKTESVDSVPKSEAESSWSEEQFLRLIEAVRVPFNDSATKSGGTLRNVSTDGTRTWVEASDAELVLYYKPPEGLPSAKPVIRLSSQMPALLETPFVLPAVIVLVFVGWSVCLIIGRIGQAIFGSRLTPASEYQAVQGRLGDSLGNVLVLGSNVPNQMGVESYHRIDFDTVMRDETWIDTVRVDIAKARGVAIGLLN